MGVNPDFKDLLSALCAADAEAIIVGAHAVMFYSEPRYTKDLDLWVRPTPANATRVLQALQEFGAPTTDLSIEDLSHEGTIFQIGIEPNRIDVVTSIEGVSFDDAWPRRVTSTYGSIPVAILSREDLIRNKRAVGRPQDQIDLDRLREE